MLRTKYFIFAFLIIGSFLSCKQNPISTESTIHIRLKKDPDRLNPLTFPNPVAREVYQYIHISPADYDPVSLQLSTVLITKMPVEMTIDTGIYAGGIAYEIEFKEEARWDDGSPITAKDYIFSMKAINLPLTDAGNYRSFTENISDIILNPDNERKCTVIFGQDYMLALETAVNIELYPQYFYDSLNVLGSYDFGYFTKENADEIKNDASLQVFAEAFNSGIYSRDKISGAGPYKFVSWTADQHIVLEKKADYWAKNTSIPTLRQGPDKMIFHIIPDEVTAIAQLRLGNIDVINEVSSQAYSELEQDNTTKDKFGFFHPALTKQYYILLNNQDPILQDVHVRKALAHLVDVGSIIRNFEQGKAVRTFGPVHPLKKTFNTALKPVAFDVDTAKALLAMAGWIDSNQDGILDKTVRGKTTNLQLEILITGQELGKNIAILLQENGRKVGMDIKITEKDMKLIRAEHVKPRKFQLVPSILSQDLQMWDDMSKWHASNNTPEGNNEIGYVNQEVTALINRIPEVKDEQERIEIYKNIQQHIYDDQACIFLYAPEERIIISNNWKATTTVKRPGYLANTFEYIGATISK